MYQALYRKFRPTAFSDVVGQEHVVTTLKNQIKTDKVGHAYLFTGTRGTGKTSCAKILARAVNCLNHINGDPCNECEMCKGILDGTVLDVVEMDAASNDGVDDIRIIRDETAYTPAKAKKKVYIIDEVHMLSSGAFNALLKTLEEPPEHIIFILATTEVHKLPATILSRCQRFDFKRISVGEIKMHLANVCNAEKIEYEDDALLLIARLGDGAMRDALSILDRCVGSENKITVDAVLNCTGSAGASYVRTLAKAISERNSGKCLEIIDELYSSSKDMSRLCEEVISLFRDMLIVKTTETPEKILAYTKKEAEELREISSLYSPENILYCIDTLESCLLKMTRSASKRTEAEICFIKLCDASLSDSTEAVLQRIAALEAKLKSGAFFMQSTQEKAVVDKKEEAPQKNEEIPTKPQEDISVKEAPADFWADVVENYKNSGDSMFHSFLKRATAGISGDILNVYIDVEAFGSFFTDNVKEEMASIIKNITGKSYTVKIVDNANKKQSKKKASKEDEFLKLLNENPDIELEN